MQLTNIARDVAEDAARGPGLPAGQPTRLRGHEPRGAAGRDGRTRGRRRGGASTCWRWPSATTPAPSAGMRFIRGARGWRSWWRVGSTGRSACACGGAAATRWRGARSCPRSRRRCGPARRCWIPPRGDPPAPGAARPAAAPLHRRPAGRRRRDPLAFPRDPGRLRARAGPRGLLRVWRAWPKEHVARDMSLHDMRQRTCCESHERRGARDGE